MEQQRVERTRIVSARKATLATAVGSRQRRGAAARVNEGWLQCGDPPQQLHQMRSQTQA